MSMMRLWCALFSITALCDAWDNSVARTPPLGFSNWNYWRNNFNASVFRETAKFMRDKGFLQAGFNYITLGGIGYAAGATPGGNITRNATGFLQIDPVKFPGDPTKGIEAGNAALRALAEDLREMGFKWGAYTEAGTAGCNGAQGSSEGFEAQDVALFVDDWKSEYLMIDSCGVEQQPPPHGPPPGFPGGQARWEMQLWHQLLSQKVSSSGAAPVVLHDCHNGCASAFGGPTLAAAPCNASDVAQLWHTTSFAAWLAGAPSPIVDGLYGQCAGCAAGALGGCANDAAKRADGLGTGLGMQGCLNRCSGYHADNVALRAKCSGAGVPAGLGRLGQTFNYTRSDGTIRNAQGGVCLELNGTTAAAAATAAAGEAIPVVGGEGGHPSGESWPPACPKVSQHWDIDSTAALAGNNIDNGSAPFLIRSRAEANLCLTSRGQRVEAPVDPWCLANNNMWRSDTDTLQVWTRTMIEVESVALQGHISRPGAWSFPDCLELGVPGQNTLTWEESKSTLALFALTSAPLLLGNDARAGRMQQRLVDLLTNQDMLAVNQNYSTSASFAGGRVWSGPPHLEIWAKPLPGLQVGAGLFNRGGTVIGTIPNGSTFYPPMPPHCNDPNSTLDACTGCFVDDDKPWLAPCDDNATASTGAQAMRLDFSQLPRSWFIDTPSVHVGLGKKLETLTCDVYDVFATAKRGALLGRFRGGWSTSPTSPVPPHGIRFLRIGNCSASK